MDLPDHLKRSIENTHVAFEGLSHPLRVVSVDAEPPQARITVETVHNGETKRASCPVDPATLDDEREVVITLAERMRGVLSGEER